MTKYVAIISAKGGVGKTAITINLTQALVGFGRQAIAVDADLTAPNVSVQLGMPQLHCTLHDVLNGKGTVQDCIYNHPSGIPVIGGRLAYELSDEVNYQKLVNLFSGLENMVEIVLIDAPPGMGNDARTVLQAVDSVIVITTPELPSVTDSRKTIKLARELGKEVIGVVLNEVRNEQYEMTKDNVEAFLDTKVIAVVPDDPAVRVAIYKNYPVVSTHPDSMAAVAIKKLAAGLIGERYEAKAPEPDVKTVREKILEHLGLNE
jgi:septum site-determining protein MinD